MFVFRKWYQSHAKDREAQGNCDQAKLPTSRIALSVLRVVVCAILNFGFRHRILDFVFDIVRFDFDNGGSVSRWSDISV